MYGRTVSVRSARCNCICDGSLRVCVVRICPYQMGIWSLYITTFSVCVYASVYVSGGVVVCACVSWCGCHSGVRVSGSGYWRVSSYVQMCLGMGALAACVCGISGKILDSAFVVCVYDGVRGYVYVGGCGGMGWSVNMRVCAITSFICIGVDVWVCRVVCVATFISVCLYVWRVSVRVCRILSFRLCV